MQVEKRISAADRLAGPLDEDVVDDTGCKRRHLVLLDRVVFDLAEEPDGDIDKFFFHRCRLDS